ncbi:Serine/threonine-protein phosphatase 6 regulatory ankyrin repeat subunit B [Acipenser ruthenus]|uniref:Serine/threonine-protein phosphatase 6 regulatory ankyrin repeat subunit B n=1 Tax=Acipenser ruthenus TaxID=7906 RepID=A0A444TXZ5_ACIRT|nr:Serine/threonine-protein phosphatase 6 regulatory ankyrin repeat subunit B [Acipenser ruthenus]
MWLTPLHRAVASRSEDAVRVLIRHSADVNARDKSWQAPLHVAAANKALRCAEVIIIPLLSSVNVSDRGGRTALHHAVLNGHVEMVNLLLEKGANINAFDKKDRSALHWAAYMGHLEVVSLLINHGAEISCKDKRGYTPLHAAASNGQLGVVKHLLNLSVEIDEANAFGNTALHIGCFNGQDAVVSELIDYGANVNQPNNKGFTPLHFAAASTHGALCLEFLVNNGADVNMQSRDGKSPLHMTAVHGRFTRSQTLIQNGGEIDCVDKDGNTPLHIAARHGHELLINTLITNGADSTKRGIHGMFPLHLAALKAHSDCCRKLLSSGFEIDTPDSFGRTCLHAAAAGGNVDCVKLLLSSGADFNKKDKCGRTPLHYSAASRHFQCIETLVSTGTSVNAADDWGRCALHYAAASDLDRKRRGILGETHGAVEENEGSQEEREKEASLCLEFLLQNEANPSIRDKQGYSAVHYAAAYGHRHCLELLLDRAHSSPEDSGSPGGVRSPLHLAAYHGHAQALDVLLQSVSDLDAVDEGGRTPLSLAALRGHAECVEALLSQGASVNVTEKSRGRTPVHLAAMNGHTLCLQLLIEGAESADIVDVADSRGQTPLMLAVANGHMDAVDLLLLDKEARVDRVDSQGCTALHLGEASYLLGDCRGRTALHFAAARGQATWLCDFLPNTFSEGNPALRDSQGYTLLHWACYNGHENCVEVLLEQKACRSFEGNSFSPLHCAVIKNHESCASILLDTLGSGIVECRDIKGRTPLHAAAFSDSVDCVQLLLSHGAPVNTVDQSGRSAVMMAAEHGRAGAVEVLVTSANANLSLRDENKNTAFHLACSNGHEKCALLILGKIEDQNLINATNAALQTVLLYGSGECQEVDSYWSTTKVMPDNQGLIVTVVIVKVFKIKDILFTGSSLGFHEAREQGKVPSPQEGWISGGKALCPLHLAARNGLKQVVQLLLSRGASVQALDENGHTPALACAPNKDVADCLALILATMMPLCSPCSSGPPLLKPGRSGRGGCDVRDPHARQGHGCSSEPPPPQSRNSQAEENDSDSETF